MSERSYEQCVDRLREVVDQLEQGNLGIEDSLRLFEEGMALSRTCEEKLAAVEQQVRVLVEGEAAAPPTPAPPASPAPAMTVAAVPAENLPGMEELPY